MKEMILIKVGELALKGLNRRTFEDVLVKNIKRSISYLGPFEVKTAQSTVYVTPLRDGADLDEAARRIGCVFGIAAYSRACFAEKSMDSIKINALEYLKEQLELVSTFKVEAKRSDKQFPLKSPQICAELGGYLLEHFPHLGVDVHNPELTVTVEVRDFGAYIHGQALRGAGGIPVGTGGRAAILISGGIDSPVAAYMMGKTRRRAYRRPFCKPALHERARRRKGQGAPFDCFALQRQDGHAHRPGLRKSRRKSVKTARRSCSPSSCAVL